MKTVFSLIAFVLIIVTNVKAAPNLFISIDNQIVTINPASLEMTWETSDSMTYPLSLPIPNLGYATNLHSTKTGAQWQLPDLKATVGVQLSKSNLFVHILSEKTGEFTFPVIPQPVDVKGWILPMFEGVYAPAGDAKWISFLIDRGEMNTTADFTLPFLALDYGNTTLTYIFTNQFNNNVSFLSSSNQLKARFIHSFTRNQPVKEYAVLIQLGKGSPIEPAHIYRQWLIQRGEFVSLKEKIQKTPEVEKLLGAPHAYIWGDELLTHTDISNWKQFAQQLTSASTNSQAVKKIWNNLSASAKEAATNILKAEWPDKYTKSLIVEELNKQLLKTNFYDHAAWQNITLTEPASGLLKRNPSSLSQAELCQLHSFLLVAAFPGSFTKPETWGNGSSPKMIQQLAAAGFDRFWLGTPAWDGLINRPETVAAAKKAGYLIGTYDSYHSMHHPKEADTWQTAQFDQKIYETGAIVNADGTKRHGFKKKGYLLSPAAARPYVEERVTRLMKIFHANSWFIDCDGFGEFFDDYSPNHPATQQSDMQNRIARLAWIRDTFGAVIGTEGCSSGIAPTVHFAHGIMTPVIGWGDPDLNDKKSKYYLGSYYPPEEPRVFFQPVATKEEYRYIYFDPRFRLPLFQTVFHDSVIATHHWTFGSFKTQDNAKTVELLELLYNIPPLYHLNLAEFQKRKAAIKHHYDFFSPLHRQAALLPMTDFKWLNSDHTIQQTTFGDELDLIANFSSDDFLFKNQEIPKGTILARHRTTGKTENYRP